MSKLIIKLTFADVSKLNLSYYFEKLSSDIIFILLNFVYLLLIIPFFLRNICVYIISKNYEFCNNDNERPIISVYAERMLTF